MQPIQIFVGLGLLVCMSVADTSCGYSARAPRGAQNDRIVHGVNATAGAWPWIVALIEDGRPMCGGSIIANQWILSAAHCFGDDHKGGKHNIPRRWTVAAGDHALYTVKDNPEGHQFKDVQKIISHVSWRGSVTDYGDIALLKLSEPLSYNSRVQPICLPKITDRFDEYDPMCYAAGWGETFGRSESTEVLQQVHSEISDIYLCNDKYDEERTGRGPLHTAAQLCFGDGRKGTCMGDSGGPLMCKKGEGKNARWMLAGATSWGTSVCEGKPGIFTKVSHYRDWIDDNMKANP